MASSSQQWLGCHMQVQVLHSMAQGCPQYLPTVDYPLGFLEPEVLLQHFGFGSQDLLCLCPSLFLVGQPWAAG